MPAGNTSTTHGTNLSTGHAKGASTLFRHLSGKHLTAAMLLGLALRLFFVIHFPFYAGDTKFYDELARNWLDHGVYGLFVHGQLVSVDMRMPGYPAFLAGVYVVFGRTTRAVMLSQADGSTTQYLSQVDKNLPNTWTTPISTATASSHHCPKIAKPVHKALGDLTGGCKALLRMAKSSFMQNRRCIMQ